VEKLFFGPIPLPGAFSKFIFFFFKLILKYAKMGKKMRIIINILKNFKLCVLGKIVFLVTQFFYF